MITQYKTHIIFCGFSNYIPNNNYYYTKVGMYCENVNITFSLNLQVISQLTLDKFNIFSIPIAILLL